MPRLVRGGKWVFGWVVVGPVGQLTIPPAAWVEYGFRVGDEVTFLPSSRRSGGFGLTHSRLLAGMPGPLRMRALARGRVETMGRVVMPSVVGLNPGDRLLVVRGSSRSLGFVARGPIFDEAVNHPELACFGGVPAAD